MVKVLQVSPTFFSARSVIGGGERHVNNVCRAIATLQDRSIECGIVSFGDRAEDGQTLAGTPLRVLNGSVADPRSVDCAAFDDLVRVFDVVHVHQCLTEFGVMLAARARLAGRLVVGTDHGGGSMPVLAQHPRLFRMYSAFQASSAFGCAAYQGADVPVHHVPGPVDDGFFTPGTPQSRDHRTILAVGRVVPRKGLDVVIDALPTGLSLVIAGPSHDPGYSMLLREKATGKDVTFADALSEEDLLTLMRHAGLFVRFSQHRDCYGRSHLAPELLGLGPLEALCTGLPAIISPAGALRELGTLPGCIVAHQPADLAQLLARWADGGLPTPPPDEISRGAGERYGLLNFAIGYAAMIASL